jgi:hypothetical protein
MALPNFLIIGAMKSATTSLYASLRAHPDVTFSVPKEPNALIDPFVLTPEGRQKYAAQCASEYPTRLVGDASTSYTKIPEYPGVPERARAVLGPDIRIIYSVREPLARARSHHHHDLIRGRAPVSFEEAMVAIPGIRDFGLYAMQLEAWLAYYPMSQIKVVRFEDYIADPDTVFDDVLRFLDLEEGSVRPERAWNVSTTVRPALGMAYRIHFNPVYRRLVRPFSPKKLRNWVIGLSNPHADAVPDPPRPETLEELRRFYAEDSQRLAEMLGWDHPLWPRREDQQAV